MNEIIPHLWLGNRYDATDIGENPKWAIVAIHDGLEHELLDEPKIAKRFSIFVNRKNRVNGTGVGKNPKDVFKGPIDTVDGVPWYDSKDLVVDLKVLNRIGAYIHNQLLNGKNVLVHCVGGIHRSPLVVAWFLQMWGYVHDLLEAYKLIRSKRPEVEERLFWLPEEERRKLFMGDSTIGKVE